MLRPIYVVRWNYAPERHLRKREGHQLTCSCQSKACAVDVNAHLGVHTAQGVENKELQTKMGRLAHRIHAKSAPQACRAGDKERCGLLCCVAQSLVPCMYRQRLPLVRTPWHHLSSYQSLVFGMYRQACSSYALLGTPRQLPTPGSWHVSPAPAAHTHSLAPPRQLSKLWFLACMVFGMYRQRLQLIRTPWYPLISYLLVSHRRSSELL